MGFADMRRRSRDRFSAPRHRQVTTLSLKIMRAARDAGDLPVSTVHVRKVGSTWSCTHRSRRFVTDVPRTVFLGLLRAAPGGVTLLTTAFDAQHRLTARMSPQVDVTGVRGEEPSSPGTRSLGRDAKAANLRKATVPLPHLKTPPETPLVGKDAVNIILFMQMSSESIRPPTIPGPAFRLSLPA